MIVRLRLPDAPERDVVLPSAPSVDDVIVVDEVPYRVADRRFVVPMEGESSVVLFLEGTFREALVKGAARDQA